MVDLPAPFGPMTATRPQIESWRRWDWAAAAGSVTQKRHLDADVDQRGPFAAWLSNGASSMKHAVALRRSRVIAGVGVGHLGIRVKLIQATAVLWLHLQATVSAQKRACCIFRSFLPLDFTPCGPLSWKRSELLDGCWTCRKIEIALNHLYP